MSLASGSIHHNTATSGNGGGIWTARSLTLGSGVSVYLNTASNSSGGGIYATGATGGGHPERRDRRRQRGERKLGR